MYVEHIMYFYLFVFQLIFQLVKVSFLTKEQLRRQSEWPKIGVKGLLRLSKALKLNSKEGIGRNASFLRIRPNEKAITAENS